MSLSIVIPAYNESRCIAQTTIGISDELERQGIDYEILVINDNSTDDTGERIDALTTDNPRIRRIDNTPPHGFGFAVRCGLETFQKKYVVIFMADSSDDPKDVVRFYKKAQEGYDCVFGTRWSMAGSTKDYPMHKKVLNRLVNNIIRLLFQVRYDDCTNACKLYSRETIKGLKPFLSHHFNLTVELPLKAIVRGYRYTVISNKWRNRQYGTSNLHIHEMGSRYLFIILYCLLEKWLSKGDYKYSNQAKALTLSED